jgi:hypothetical protein
MATVISVPAGLLLSDLTGRLRWIGVVVLLALAIALAIPDDRPGADDADAPVQK